ncbi:helix-turn-helix domain-containing protein [Saccharopolyspora shandongensis]|uniref:helix-turn-helix domain-containing protein n=1 Tax=Saccharopolyspora shandongensis TaxID=418495 RepID=UPI003401D515
MKWNLRMIAAQRGIWKATDLQRRLAARGLVVSAGKMSGMWRGIAPSVKLSELGVLCAVLEYRVDELLVPGPSPVPQRREEAERR